MFHKPEIVILVLWEVLAPIISDKLFLKVLFRLKMGYWIDFNNPRTFNEKLQWLKLYNRKLEYTTMVDKFGVKKYVAAIIGEEHIIPTLGVYSKFEEIDFNTLPNQFVLKVTHDSGGIVICKNKFNFDIEAARNKLNKSLKKSYYYQNREWPYKNVKRRIICEKYMVDESGYELKDYKWFCFNGEPKIFKIDFDRYTDHRANYYDRQCRLLPFGEIAFLPKYEKPISLPDNIESMVRIAKELSKNQPFLRVDLYNSGGKIYFGEITFYPNTGMGKFTDDSYDLVMGSWIELSSKECKQSKNGY